MSMSAPTGGSNLNNDMNVTPMIDVLLVLLIIFMMIIPMSRKALDAQLPDPTPQPASQVNSVNLQILGVGVAREFGQGARKVLFGSIYLGAETATDGRPDPPDAGGGATTTT